jgi:hypothetical protein
MMAKTPQEAAAIEAFEEAGVRGRIVDKVRLGSYRYQKLNPSGLLGELTVGVFLMQVYEQLAEWPERAERTTKWFSLGKPHPMWQNLHWGRCCGDSLG